MIYNNNLKMMKFLTILMMHKSHCEINNLLKEEDGTKITFDIERKNQKMSFEIKLIDPIPYQDAN